MSTGEVKYQSRQESNIQPEPKGAGKVLLPKLSRETVLSAEDRELLKAAAEARDEWIENNANFEHVSDELLIDYYTYRIKASEARYAYFIRRIKEKGLSRYL